MNKEPTEAQVKEFWEWVFDGKVQFGRTIGGKLVCYRQTRWIEADEEWGIEVIPDMDSLEFLGFLFKYAVPKLRSIWLQTSEDGKAFCQALLGDTRSQLSINKDPALALFYVCEEVINAK